MTKFSDRERKLIDYIKSLGIQLNTQTKARGHQGIYFKNRIDISNKLPQERIIPTILHEFAHYIHNNIEPEVQKNGGTFEKIFDTNDNLDEYKKELLLVTNFVDSTSKFENIDDYKDNYSQDILDYESIIKNKYPDFKRSKPFSQFDKYIKKSKAKYLVKHDNVRLVSGIIFQKVEILSIDNIEEDFPNMPKEFVAYIKLKSLQRKVSRISRKKSKLSKYYNKPTELFARFVEGLYLNPLKIKEIAPITYARFIELLQNGYYSNLKDVFNIIL